MPRVVIVRNPASRHAVSRAVLETACAALDASWEVEIVDSTRALGVAVVARNAALADVDYVLACGGDGTLNEVLNGVVSAERPDVVVGLIPAGTANVWAREARIPRDPLAAVRLLSDGVVVALDLGRVRAGRVDRRFLLMCSLGVDASVVAAVEQRGRLKRRFAQAAYVIAGIPVLRQYEPVQIEVDGSPPGEPVALAVAGNSQLYGGVLRLTPHARMDDGLLDLVLFRVRWGRWGWVDVAGHLARIVARRPRATATEDFTAGSAESPRHHSRRHEYWQARGFSLRPRASIPIQADGEFLLRVEAGEFIRLEAEPSAIRMLVPPAANPLFTAGAMPTPRSA